MTNEKRWKTMLRRLSYLLAEYTDSQEHYETSKAELEARVEQKMSPHLKQTQASLASPANETQDIVKSHQAGSDSKQPDNTESKSIPPTKDPEVHPEMEHYRRLWRAIAKYTHPDVVGDDEHLLTAYKEASEAYEAERYEELFDVAAELNISLTDPDPVLIIGAAKRCDHYEQQIILIRKTAVWEWGSASPIAKEALVEVLSKRRKHRDIAAAEKKNV